MGLVHPNLKIGWLLDRIGKVDDQVVVDDVLVRGNTLFTHDTGLDNINSCTVSPPGASNRRLQQVGDCIVIVLPVTSTSLNSGCSALSLIIPTMGGVSMADGAIHILLNELSLLIEIDRGAHLDLGSALTLHALALLVNVFSVVAMG